MPASLPQRTRIYQCHHLDSTRWDGIVPRPDDVAAARALTPELKRWLERGAASGVVPK